MSKIIGIDLGTTNSCVAVMEGGKPVVVANAEGGRTTPSVVAFKGEERLVGQVARRQAVMNPRQTLHSVKRFIGRSYEDVADEAAHVPYELTADASGAVRIRVDGKDLAPEEVSARILRKLVDDASKYLGEPVTKAVITVPAYFDDAQRNATRDAGRIAGIEVVRVVNEPTAAALAYGLESDRQETVLVFDLGGGTFDVSVLEVGDGVCEVRATSGDTRLGGDDFDAAVVTWLIEQFRAEHGIDVSSDRQALQRLSEAAERAKCELSTATTTRINLPFLTADGSGPKHLDVELTRARFDQLTESLVERCREPVRRALADAGVAADAIDHVLLVGGSTRIPAVQALVRELAGGREPNQSVNPDEVVALGAAVQAGILAGEVQDVLLLDVTPLSLGVETMGGVMHRLIERNTTIPCSRKEVFSTAVDDQPAVDVVVLQGEREMARDNRVLAQFRLEGIRPAPRGTPQIEVSFELDANGILSVSARDQATGKEQRVQVTDSTRLEQAELDRMVAEAERHSAEDRRRREQAEKRNRVDQLCYGLERGRDVATESLVKEARDALGRQVEGSELDDLLHRLEQAAAAQASAAQGCGPEGCAPEDGAPACANPHSGATVDAESDDVIDADFTVR